MIKISGGGERFEPRIVIQISELTLWCFGPHLLGFTAYNAKCLNPKIESRHGVIILV